MHIRLATATDIPALHPVIEGAYRGDSARTGWTFESDILHGPPRTDPARLAAILNSPDDRLLIALEDDKPIGCVQITDCGGGTAYLGLLCIAPLRQAGGLGRQLIDAAEALARDDFATTTMEMTVIDRRTELISYYERRGYTLTGEARPFPIPFDPPLSMAVLAKALAANARLG
ncbi:GNAT family N-acetyltransferase [Sphingobium aromaticiconvertens]|uniref:GNAT family N-acetyltransferase n=1 Tax=Sphingobium aromaticiconvertens TaxID=365341 RepID=UPI0030185783